MSTNNFQHQNPNPRPPGRNRQPAKPNPRPPGRNQQPAKPSPRQLGIAGEDAAAKWYQDRGWQILARNWRFGRGELDIIASQQDTVVFCEVKTRSSANFAWPSEAVNHKKQLQIRKLAVSWLEQSDIYYPIVRFDVAEVLPRAGRLEVEVYEDAF